MLRSFGFDYPGLLAPFFHGRALESPFDQIVERAAAEHTIPRLNVWMSEGMATVVVEAPGAAADKIDVSVEGNRLTLRSQAAPTFPEGERVERRERDGRAFEREIELPFEINAEKVTAQYAHGILTISLPRSASQSARRIAVRS